MGMATTTGLWGPRLVRLMLQQGTRGVGRGEEGGDKKQASGQATKRASE
jgi:hypothetical protein